MESRLTSYNILPSLVILAMAAGMLMWYSSLSSNTRDIIYWLPYGLAAITAILALQFNRRQLVVVVFVNAFSYWLIFSYLQQPLDVAQARVAYALVCVFIPINLVANQFIRENGSRTRRAWICYCILLIQVIAIAITVDFLSDSIVAHIDNWFTPRPIDGFVISLNALGLLTLCSVLAFVRFINQPTSISIGLFFSFVASTFPIIFLDREAISSVFFTASLLIMLFSGFSASHELAYRDELTGLLGRRMLFEKLAGLSKNYTLAMVDIDHFKKFNDTYGHDVGDDVLAMVAAKLDQIEGGGQVFRYGGEEFTVLFKGKKLNHAIAFLDDTREIISETPFVIRDKNSREKSDKSRRDNEAKPKETVQITVSIGVAEKSSQHYDAQEVIKDADNALYKAKNKGRNVVVG
ncbi:diguanylate cyclase [Agarivorans sp. MS3-6]|uniref:GGDEF domain-containing protein n=1 Tax=Agarivorans sp. TSD2052 TaxID=2937286 RepID=UPI002010A996|nr:GGDEF domain-containing protein [Agarivorans sp. TSD2052]UPW20509.1 GGDEF domain-containing protein [Agarivorans sp. TSD2052]